MQTKSFAYLLAAGILLLPVCGIAAEKSESHTVTTAEETSADEAKNDAPASEDKKLAEEMDELGGEVEEPQDTRVKQNGKESGQDSTEEKSTVSSDEHGARADAAHETDAPPTKDDRPVGYAYVGDKDAWQSAMAADRTADTEDEDEINAAVDEVTAEIEKLIDKIYEVNPHLKAPTLAEGHWVFVEGDERRGWFVDRGKMHRNKDGTISYWQLILYNEFGRAQFADAMHDEDYKELRYTLQRRVMDLKKNTVSTYAVIAVGADEKVLADSARDGEPAEIRPDTMAENERDTVKKLAHRLKFKQ
jgi:possible cell envelope integrity inner membrane protein tolA